MYLFPELVGEIRRKTSYLLLYSVFSGVFTYSNIALPETTLDGIEFGSSIPNLEKKASKGFLKSNFSSIFSSSDEDESSLYNVVSCRGGFLLDDYFFN